MILIYIYLLQILLWFHGSQTFRPISYVFHMASAAVLTTQQTCFILRIHVSVAILAY